MTPERLLIRRDFLPAPLIAQLRTRWATKHKETGYLPDSAITGSAPVTAADDRFDRKEKYRLDHWVPTGTRLDADLCRRFRQELRTVGFRGGVLEKFRVGCYVRGGHFSAHRDDSPSTDGGRRRWTLVCPLSDPQTYTGGELVFPELGLTFKPAAGTALVFDARLLHGVRPVRHGRRFVLISFVSK